MILNTDKYVVTTDGNQFTLQSKKVVEGSPSLKDKSKIGTIATFGDKKHFTNLESLFKGMVKYKLLDSDEIKSFECIMNLINETADEIKSASL